ncbi:MAG: radical SAM protein [Bacteroidota bacterium]|nr:radical SAM protein [Bacteroidota bacterium]
MQNSIVNINFEITYLCNQQCLYCYNATTVNGNSRTSGGNVIKVLDKLIGNIDFTQLTLTGGEPLLSAEIEEVIIHAIVHNKKVSVISNGSSNQHFRYKKLIDYGVETFQLTINSASSAIHDNLSQTTGAWERTVKTIEFILANNGKIVPTIILTKENIAEIDKVMGFLQDYGFQTIMINRFNVVSNKPNSISLLPSHNELKKAFELINNFAISSGIRITSNVCSPHCILDPQDYSSIIFGTCPDNHYLKPITVDMFGGVRLCNHSTKIIGNIFNHKLDDILLSEYALGWNSTIPEYCANCIVYDSCRGGCRAASEQFYNNHLIVDPIVELLK